MSSYKKFWYRQDSTINGAQYSELRKKDVGMTFTFTQTGTVVHDNGWNIFVLSHLGSTGSLQVLR
jgi:hypothetical protein